MVIKYLAYAPNYLKLFVLETSAGREPKAHKQNPSCRVKRETNHQFLLSLVNSLSSSLKTPRLSN